MAGSFSRKAAAISRKEGVSAKRGRAILAAGAQNASAAAKRRNPNLKKVSGA